MTNFDVIKGADGTTEGLKNISEKGVPKVRLSDPDSARNMVEKMIRADESRSKVRAMTKGLVDGNPPFRQSDLVKHGQAHRANFNDRNAEAFLNQAIGAIYDVFSETPTYAEVRLDEEDRVKREEWSTVATEEFERFQRRDRDFDFAVQLSQHEMMMYGIGPLVFEDIYSPKVTAVRCGNMYLHDNTVSDVGKWEVVVFVLEYSSSELYDFIQDSESARAVGWNIPATRKAIMAAHPQYRQGTTQGRMWEWHQQRLRNNNLGYADEADTIPTAIIFYREFAREPGKKGKISKIIIPREAGDTQKFSFLFQKPDYCDDWGNVVNPMYYDHGDGTHHSVKGMGIKFYSSLLIQLKLKNSLADKAMQPKLALKPLNSEATSRGSMIAMHGDYLILPPGHDIAQFGMSGMLEDTLIVKRDFESNLSANLGQYRQNLSKTDGNPITATEAQYRAGEQARLGKTQLARYYEQFDRIYEERFRRAAEPKIPKGCHMYDEVKTFQERCVNRGVPLEALQNVESVKMTRLVGQGSSMLRQQVLTEMLGIVAMLPENGRLNLIRDFIASKAGTVLTDRYAPKADFNRLPDDHVAQAWDQVAGMKVGLPPTVTDSQNHVTYINVFLQAAAQAIQSLQQGGNPAEVAQFLELSGMAIMAHLQQIQNDPSRKELVKAVTEQVKQLAQIKDQLVKQIQKQRQQQAKMAQQQNTVMNEQQLAQFRTQQDEQRKNAKLLTDTQRKDIKTQSDLQRKNLTTAQQMRLNDATTAHKIQLEKLEAEHEMALAEISSSEE